MGRFVIADLKEEEKVTEGDNSEGCSMQKTQRGKRRRRREKEGEERGKEGKKGVLALKE